MGLAKPKIKIGVEDYLKGENSSEIRHEFVYGEIFAMAGTSDRHNRIAGNIFSRIDNHLGNSRFETFIESVKLKADEQTFYYPDVMVACDKQPKSAYYREEPILLVEILSPSIERTDRHEKLAVYKNIPSLREYLIVSQDKIYVEVHRRINDGENWQTEIYDEIDAEILLDSIDFSLTLAEIYRRVNFQNSTDEYLQ
jgi:Uma2 family endonuclease